MSAEARTRYLERLNAIQAIEHERQSVGQPLVSIGTPADLGWALHRWVDVEEVEPDENRYRTYKPRRKHAAITVGIAIPYRVAWFWVHIKRRRSVH